METILYLSPRWAALWAASRHHHGSSNMLMVRLRCARSLSTHTGASSLWNDPDSKSFRGQGIPRSNDEEMGHWWSRVDQNKSSTASNIACYPTGNPLARSSPPTVGGTVRATTGAFLPNICGTKRARDHTQEEDAVRNIRSKRNLLVFLESSTIPFDLFAYTTSKHSTNTRKRHRRRRTSLKRVVDPSCLVSYDDDDTQSRMQETPKETSLCDAHDGDDNHRVSHCPTTLTFEGKDGSLVTRAGYYSGPLVHGKMQGDGVFWFDDGSLYVGHFEGNHLEGMGALSITHRRQKVQTKPSHNKVYHGIFHDNVLVESCSAHHRHHHHHHKTGGLNKTHAGQHA